MHQIALLLLMLGLGSDKIDYETAHLDRRIHAIKITDKVTIDGRLEERAWEAAPLVSNFIQAEPNEGDPSSEKTEVRVLYDAENLYFGIYAHDSHSDRVVVSDLKKDFATDQGDIFTIMLDTFHDRRNGYQFIINPAGAKWDAQMINEGREVN